MIVAPPLSAQSKEQVSRDQFRECMHLVGWKPIDIHQDDGEDFSVEVYIDGRHTGVNFYVQLKSGFDLGEAPRSGFVPCQVDVPHLLRWAEFPMPVVLIAWDINRREGRWVFVADAVHALDARDADWRSGKTRTVRVPWSNATDNAGLQDLRRIVGMVMFPLLARGRSLTAEFNLRYSDTDEGSVAAGEVTRGLAEGRQVRIPGAVIADARFSFMNEWLRGDGDFSRALLVIEPIRQPFPVRVEVESVRGPAMSSPLLTLYSTSVVADSIKLANKDSDDLIKCELTLGDGGRSCSLSLSWSILGVSAEDASDLLKFQSALADGAEVRLHLESMGDSLSLLSEPRPELMPDHSLVEVIDDLRLIADRFKVTLRVPSSGLSSDEVREINELGDISRTGRFTRASEHGTINVRTTDPTEMFSLGPPGAVIQLENTWESEERTLAGVSIALGSALRRVSGVVKSLCLRREASARRPAEVDVSVIEVKEDWFYPDIMIEEARRLSSRLATLFGARKVFLFGSLAWPDHRIINGDIDLAVDGLPLERFLDAVAWLDRATTFDVDLVQLESLPEPLRSRIIAEGDVLSAS